MTLLSIIQNVCDEVVLPRPSVVAAATDDSTRQLLQLLNRTGQLLARKYRFQAITIEGHFVTVAAESQGLLATVAGADFDRFVNDTFFDRTRKWQIGGPLTSKQYQQRKGTITSSPWSFIRIKGNYLLMTPTPSAGNSIYFEYVSKNWCQSAASVGQDEFLADTDTGIVDERLLELGTIWRWRKNKGFAYAEDKDTFEKEAYSLAARDGAKTIIDMSAPETPVPTANFPDGGWNL